MLEFISPALSIAKTATDISKTIIDISKDAAVKDKARELRGIIDTLYDSLLKARVEQESLLNIKVSLEKKLIEYENWEHKKSKYQLEEVSAGVFVYESKSNVNPAEPSHWLCQKCFHDKKVSIIQYESPTNGGKVYVCHTCSSKIITRTSTYIAPEKANRRDRFERFKN